MNKMKQKVQNSFPLLGLIFIVVFFTALTGGRILNGDTLQSILANAMLTALVSTGSVFVFGMGCFDMSVGGTLCLSAVLGCYAGIATGSIAAVFFGCLAAALLLNLLKGIFAAYVEVPFFIVTIVLGSVLSALVLVIMGTETTVFFKNAVKPIATISPSGLTILNMSVLAAYFLLCLVLFNYTRIGQEVKLLGGNPATYRQTGLHAESLKIVSFLISGLGIALAAFVLLMRTRTAGSSSGSTMGTDVMVALVLGGMPLSGGPRSRISAGLIGSISITFLNMGLTMMNIPNAYIQICRAVVFIAVVYIASMSYRTKLLPR